MFDLTLQLLFFRLAALLAAAAVHGAVIAAVAVALGDPGPKYDGRLSLNPLSHLDPAGSIGAVVFQLGWIKPVAIDPTKLRSGRVGLAVIALAGLVALVLLAVLLELLRRPALLLIGGNFGLSAVQLLDVAARLAVWLAAFNVVPIPPLTGGLFLRAVSPRLFEVLDRNRLAVVIVLAILIVTGAAERFLTPLFELLATPLIR